MANAKAKTLRCPTCGTLVIAGSEDVPFCSDRCRRIDLGKWASGAYVVSSPVHDPELLDELEGLRDRQATSRSLGTNEPEDEE
jgi:endogenous inhibitor of DNA gyrase (YacG/DUF329 family)